MNGDQPSVTDHEQPSAEQLREPDPNEESSLEPGDTLHHMEKLLGEIRAALDASSRDGRYREFSLGLTVGAILQIIVAGLIVLSVLDWIMATPGPPLYIKLAFAGVLQLAALTAFVVAGGGRKR